MTTLQIVGLSLICVLAVQWGLALVCLMRLFKAKLPKSLFWKWNVLILLGIVVAPVVYLLTEKKRNAKYAPQQDCGGDNYCI